MENRDEIIALNRILYMIYLSFIIVLLDIFPWLSFFIL